MTYVKNAFKRHNLYSKLTRLERDFEEGKARHSHRQKVNSIDNTKINIMMKGEKQCRKIAHESNLPCSPEIQRTYRLKIAYQNLQRWAKGRSKNTHFIKAAWRAGINNPGKLTPKMCKDGAAACCKKMRNVENEAITLRSDHLNNDSSWLIRKEILRKRKQYNNKSQ